MTAEYTDRSQGGGWSKMESWAGKENSLVQSFPTSFMAELAGGVGTERGSSHIFILSPRSFGCNLQRFTLGVNSSAFLLLATTSGVAWSG